MDTKKLSATTAGPLSITLRAEAVGDPNRVDAGGIKKCEGGWLREEGTLIVDAVTELVGCAQVK